MRGQGLLTAVFAACVCSVGAAVPAGCAATPPTAPEATATGGGIAWRSTDRLAKPRTIALTLGAGDGIGTRLETVRVARAIRERDANQGRGLRTTAAAGSAPPDASSDR
jgi:hypothetical protein